ncbi:MAG: DUF2461 domain-containing protein [Pseudomonadota bacterium]|nr:DUF2461 domain-containing protein [Pseudomonadota bacterium]MDQ3160975.1 DUF2461 domain-containing protein [Pseudomonadota bacterium]
MSPYFSDKTLKFLRSLARHNEREWFHAHKRDYEAHLRLPFLRLLTDLQPVLAGVSTHFRADPKGVGGSLFRIHRDTRFSKDKTPYKSWQGARLYHERARQVAAPSFYLHIKPGECFVGGGLWHPDTKTQRRVRQFIVDNPGGWERAAHDTAFRERYTFESSDMLVRVPAGMPADFARADDLRHRNFVVTRALDDADVTGADLVSLLEADLSAMAPFIDYLCAALDLEF